MDMLTNSLGQLGAKGVQATGRDNVARLSSQFSFADVLDGLWNTNSDTASTGGEMDVLSMLGYGGTGTGEVADLLGLGGTYGLSLESYLALLGGQATETATGLNAALEELAEALKGIFGEDGLVNTEGLDKLEALLKKAGESLEEQALSSGPLAALQQLVLLMQRLDNPSADWYAQYTDGALSTSDEALTLLTRAVQASPEELLALLTRGSPYESIRLPMQEAQAEAQPAGEAVPKAEALLANEPVEEAVSTSNIPWADPKALEGVYEKAVQQAARRGEAQALPENSTYELKEGESSEGGQGNFNTELHRLRLGLAKHDGQPAGTAENRAQADADGAAKAGLSAQPQQGVFAVASPEAEQEAAQPAPVPIEQQLHAGIAKGLGEANSEFTIKLNPEGLGEVQVKLEKAGEMMSLSIIARNPETRDLLQAQMEVLKESLKPLKVEVDNIFTEKQYEDYVQQQSGGRQEAHGQTAHSGARGDEGQASAYSPRQQGSAGQMAEAAAGQRLQRAANSLYAYI